MSERCEGCQTDTCFTPWPDDDPHKPGQMRGCYKEATGSLTVTTVRGRERDPRPTTMVPGSRESTLAGETRPDGSFVPYIAPGKAGPMSLKNAENFGRREIERIRKRQNQGSLTKD